MTLINLKDIKIYEKYLFNQGRSEYLSITRLIAGRFFSWTPLIRWIRNILGETIKNVFTK